MNELNLNSLRSQKARLSARIGKIGFEVMVALVWLFSALAIYFFVKDGTGSRAGFGFLAVTLFIFALAIWDKWDLQKLPVSISPKSLDEIIEGKLLAAFAKNAKITPLN